MAESSGRINESGFEKKGANSGSGSIRFDEFGE